MTTISSLFPQMYRCILLTFRGGQIILAFDVSLSIVLPPKTRQGLYEDMKAAGIGRYSISAILIASNGWDCSDPFWIRFEDGPQTWKEVWAAIGVYSRK